MTVIDGEWIKARLPEGRGAKARLARHLGIKPEKLSKILSGNRSVQPEEIPKLLEFFNEKIVPLTDEDQARAELLSEISRLNRAGQQVLRRQLAALLETPELVQQDETRDEDQ